jgi:hypothetical protein
MSPQPFDPNRRKRRRRYVDKPGRPTARHVVTDRCGPTGKVRYRSARAADDALAVITENGDPRHQERRTYACELCAGWHLTKQGRNAA